MNYYLAVDIGASSGRHILGWLEDGVMKLEEVYGSPTGWRWWTDICAGMCQSCLRR